MRISSFIFSAVLLALNLTSVQAQTDTTRLARLRDHVYYLAADSLRGRKAGSPDAAKAAEYIVHEYESAGVKPLFREGWYDTFTLPGYAAARFLIASARARRFGSS